MHRTRLNSCAQSGESGRNAYTEAARKKHKWSPGFPSLSEGESASGRVNSKPDGDSRKIFLPASFRASIYRVSSRNQLTHASAAVAQLLQIRSGILYQKDFGGSSKYSPSILFGSNRCFLPSTCSNRSPGSHDRPVFSAMPDMGHCFPPAQAPNLAYWQAVQL